MQRERETTCGGEQTQASEAKQRVASEQNAEHSTQRRVSMSVQQAACTRDATQTARHRNHVALIVNNLTTQITATTNKATHQELPHGLLVARQRDNRHCGLVPSKGEAGNNQ